MKNKLAISFLACILFSTSIYAQNAVKNPATPLNTYEATKAQPYGRINPSAPAETKQFDFMIGTFDCIDKIRNPVDGKWYESKSIWESSYFLNGYGVQDKYWSPVTVATGTRIFDDKKKKWIVNYFQSLPRYFTGIWEGKKEGDDMIMRQDNGNAESRLTFSKIKKDGFDWIGERVTKESTTSGWKISCKRRVEVD